MTYLCTQLQHILEPNACIRKLGLEKHQDIVIVLVYLLLSRSSLQLLLEHSQGEL